MGINAHPIEFSVFGLGLLEESKNETIKYNIIPRKVDNSGWESGLYETVDGEMKMIHLSFDSENNGLRVKDLKCFNKLVSHCSLIIDTELLGMSLRKEMVELGSELSEKPTAIIIGD